jgi:hypothetical protein
MIRELRASIRGRSLAVRAEWTRTRWPIECRMDEAEWRETGRTVGDFGHDPYAALRWAIEQTDAALGWSVMKTELCQAIGRAWPMVDGLETGRCPRCGQNHRAVSECRARHMADCTRGKKASPAKLAACRKGNIASRKARRRVAIERRKAYFAARREELRAERATRLEGKGEKPA